MDFTSFIKWCFNHPSEIVAAITFAGMLKLYGEKLYEAIRDKHYDQIDQILVQFMIEAAGFVMDNPDRKSWVLSQTFQVLSTKGVDKFLGLKSSDDLGERMEWLWQTQVQPRIKSGEITPTNRTITMSNEELAGVAKALNIPPVIDLGGGLQVTTPTGSDGVTLNLKLPLNLP